VVVRVVAERPKRAEAVDVIEHRRRRSALLAVRPLGQQSGPVPFVAGVVASLPGAWSRVLIAMRRTAALARFASSPAMAELDDGHQE